MSRRIEVGARVAVVIVGAVAGVTIAGTPDLGSASGPPVTTTSAPVSTTTSSTTTTASTATSTTTTIAPQPRPNTEVVVLVVNGTSVVGAAGRLSDQLAASGHPTLTPTSTTPFDMSEVWFVDGFGVEAVALAERLGVFPENVTVMPPEPGFTVGEASVVVVLGPDLAS